jgi:hypothetical protein
VLPNFLIVGAQKSATRWLRLNLGRHPRVFTASRELEFFNQWDEKSPSWYVNQFAGAESADAIGEATPGYMMWRENTPLIAARIDGFLPEVRLFAVLRNPVDRTYSAFVHHMKHGRIDPSAELLDTIRRRTPEDDLFSLISGSWYAKSLRPYLDRFGARMRILLHDDVIDDPVGTYLMATGHLGIADRFVPEELEKVRFSNAVPRESQLAVGSSGRRDLTGTERERLYEYFEDDILELESSWGLNLQAWRV